MSEHKPSAYRGLLSLLYMKSPNLITNVLHSGSYIKKKKSNQHTGENVYSNQELDCIAPSGTFALTEYM